MDRCDDCAHWEYKRIDSDDKNWGHCSILDPAYRGRRLMVIQSNSAVLTRSDFGCVQFQRDQK